MDTIIIGILTILNLIGLLYFIKKGSMNLKLMCMIGLFAGISVILKSIYIPLPTGGAIALLSVTPAMILAVLYGPHAGIWVGMLSGCLVMILVSGWVPIHPLQIFVEQLGALGALGYAGVLGNNKKIKIISACLLAVIINVSFHIFSGVLFFSMNVPEGMGSWAYSITYNIGSMGVEGLLSVGLISLLPLDQLKKILKIERGIV
ncbi:hypothetical protein AN644_00895 [Candidatus Epulonipiscium fishelsonii]|nr:hypothetical protein AN644_00895 [Epulopiscium sp. SCG-C06WGA-EpuloA1]